METQEDELKEVIEHKIMKANGQIGYKKYQRGKLLWKGEFAKYYEGLNLETKKKYAIKVIKKVSLQKNRAKQKLLSQIKIHKTLHHQFIVEFDSIFEDANFVYIILELFVNKTLSQIVKQRKRLTAKETRYLMLELISAVQYMHSKRVIHRGLKLGNIFLSASMDIKVGDFGLAAKLQFSDEKKRTMCGTPNYIAPEIIERSVGHSYEVDIWSMGVICFVLLYGRQPFETSEVKITYKKIKSCKYTFPNTTVPEEAKDFIQKILILDPKLRMTTKQMLQHSFLTSEDVPKCLSVEILTQIPSFKLENQPILTKVKSVDKLILYDFRKKKSQLNLNLNLVEQGNLKNIRCNTLSSNIDGDGKASQDHRDEHKVFIVAYLDYSKRYGLGYVINNKYYGVYFKDETLISCDQAKQYYCLHSETFTLSRTQQSILSYKAESMPKDRDFQKKYLLLENFIIYLNEELDKMPQQKTKGEQDEHFIYIKNWLKTRHAIMFGLSNKLFQVNFFDNSQILLNTAKKTVLFTSKRGQKTYEALSNVLKSQENEMAQRIKYAKDIIKSIDRKKDERQYEPISNDR